MHHPNRCVPELPVGYDNDDDSDDDDDDDDNDDGDVAQRQ